MCECVSEERGKDSMQRPQLEVLKQIPKERKQKTSEINLSASFFFPLKAVFLSSFSFAGIREINCLSSKTQFGESKRLETWW